MHEPDAPAWVTEYIEMIKERRPTMIPEEKKKLGLALGKIIEKFLRNDQLTTNQEAVEILGIACMYYHSVVYATGMANYEEKP